MSEILTELTKQIPVAVALIVIVYMFMQQEDGREKRRVENAKQIEMERRQHEGEVNRMWMLNIKAILENQSRSFEKITDALREHERASAERYERLGITQDLIDAIKAQAKS